MRTGDKGGAGSWARFERRMRLRRESTCLTAMRQAMEAGDYHTAAARARELCAIDPSWNEVHLLLEQMRSRLRPAAKAAAGKAPEPSIQRPSGRQTTAIAGRPNVAAEDTIARTAKRGPWRRRLGLAVVALLLAAVAGWSLSFPLPPTALALLRSLSESDRAPDRAAPSLTPVPALPDDRPDPEIPNLPVLGVEPPPPPAATTDSASQPATATNSENGNAVSQNGQASEAPSPTRTPEGAGRPDSAAGTTPKVTVDNRRLQTRGERNRATRSTTGPGSAQPAFPGVQGARSSETASASVSARSTVAPQPETVAPPPASDSTPAQVTGRDSQQPPSGGSVAARGGGSPVAEPAAGTREPPVVALPSLAPAGESRPTSEDRAATGTQSSGGSADLNDLRDEQRAVMATLSGYARAYTALNAEAVRQLWPRVNVEALSSAFGQLESQRIAFSACNVNVEGLVAAATCRGSATYVPKVGNGAPVSLQRIWQFALRKFGDGWLIDSATTR